MQTLTPFTSWLSGAAVVTARLKERLSGSDVTSRLVRGTLWASAGALASRFFAMVSSIIVVRLLGRERYGEMGMVYSTIGMLGVFAGFGLGSAATKFIAQYRLNAPVRTGRAFTLLTCTSLVSAGAICAVLVLFSPWLAEHSLNRAELDPLLKAGALLLLFSELAGVQQGVLAGFEAFQQIAKINLLQGVLSPFITVPAVWWYGVEGAIAALTINTAFTLLLLLVAVRGQLAANRVMLDEKIALSWSECGILSSFAVPAMLSLSLTIPVTWVTNTMLVNSPGGYGELGLFNAANQWRQVIMLIPSLLSSAMLPILSQSHGEQRHAEFQRIVALNLRLVWITTLPAAVFMMILGKPLAALFGRQFQGAAPLISVLMASTFLTIVNGTVGNAVSGSGRMWTGTAMNLFWAVALLGSARLLIPHYGGLGLAAAYLVSYVCHSVWQMTYVELRLAPSALSSQWRLMVASLLLLGLCMWATIRGSGRLMYLALLLLSLGPVACFLRAKLAQFCATGPCQPARDPDLET